MVNRGRALIQLRQLSKASAVFDEALRDYDHGSASEYPEAVALALVSRGILLADAGDKGAAVQLFARCIILFGGSDRPDVRRWVGDALFERGYALTGLGRREDAAADLSRAVNEFGADLDPGTRERIALLRAAGEAPTA
jgi:tetratricopeptide (TPR) repeat protein